MANGQGNCKQWLTLFFWASESLQMVIAAIKLKETLLLGRKAMTNLDSILKSRDISLLTKICLVKAMFFPVVRYRCESWLMKKAEHQEIDAFELWCWRRFLRQEKKGTTEDEIVGWHYRLNGHESEVDDGQGGLAFYSPWGRKDLDMTE